MASVSRGYISRLEAGDFARPSAALLLRIAHALEIDVENLWDDISSNTAPRSEHPTLSDLQDQLFRLSQTLSNVRGIPIRGTGAAGTGEGSEDHPAGVLMLEDAHLPPRRWAMVVDGDSLRDDHIHSGDYVIVDPDVAPKEGMLVVAKVGDDILIKHYEPEETTIILEPANPDYPSLDAPRAQILGAVQAVMRVLEPQRVASPS
jgi:SOS-response transcriptional repressor LexA